MLLHQHFVKIARRYGNKVAFIDRTSDKRVTYTKALIASLILSEKFKKYPEGFLGIMIPTSAGSALTILGTLMSGKTPVIDQLFNRCCKQCIIRPEKMHLQNNHYVKGFADNRAGSPTATNLDVFLGRSPDGGQTWKTYPVDTSGNDQFYPWVSVGQDGRVDVGYMDRFGTGQDRCLYGFTLTRLSFDAAGNAVPLSRQLVSEAPSIADRSRWFGQNTRFIGDYNGVAIGPDGSTWSLWTDMRAAIPGAPAGRDHGQHAVGTRTP